IGSLAGKVSSSASSTSASGSIDFWSFGPWFLRSPISPSVPRHFFVADLLLTREIRSRSRKLKPQHGRVRVSGETRASESDPIDLHPGQDCWRIAQAKRATVLIDAEAYFFALRAAMLKARHSIHIVGWDIDRRMPFPGCAEDVAALAELGAPTGAAE